MLGLEFCVWRAVSSHSSHKYQKVLPVYFRRLYVLKGGLKPQSCFFFLADNCHNLIGVGYHANADLLFNQHQKLRPNIQPALGHLIFFDVEDSYPTIRSTKVGSMMAHRLRRWANIEPALGERLGFVGKWEYVRQARGGLCQVDYMSYCRSFVITGAKTPVIKGSVTCDDVIDQWSPVASPLGTLHWSTHWKPQIDPEIFAFSHFANFWFWDFSRYLEFANFYFSPVALLQ